MSLHSLGKNTQANTLEALNSLEDDSAEMIKVENLVNQFLSVQSLKVLPQGPFGEAVNQFVAKDDKHAMELFVSEHLSGQVRQMLGLESDDEDLNNAMETYKQRVEQRMATAGSLGKMAQGERKRTLKPKPDGWDPDFDGNWEDEPGAWVYEDDAPSNLGASGSSRKPQPRDDEMLDLDADEPPAAKPKRAPARATKAAPAKKAAAAKKPPARRGRKPFEDSEEEEEEPPEEDAVMESDEEEAPPPQKPAARTTRRGQNAKSTATASKPAPAKKATTRGAAAAKTRQTKLKFSQGATQDKAVEISDDEISDDDAFEPAPVASRTRRK